MVKKSSLSKFVVERFIFAILCAVLIFSACATQKKKPQPAGADVVKQLENIKKRLKTTKKDQALVALQKFIKDHPNTEISDEAYILLGDEYYAKRDYAKAHQTYMDLAQSETSTPKEAEARIKAARALIQMNRPEDALNVIDPIFKMDVLDQEQVLAGHKIRYMIALQKNDRLSALRAAVTLAKTSTSQSDKDGFRLRAYDIVDSKLTPEELSEVAGSSEFDFVRAPALFRLGVAEFEAGNYDRARSLLSQARDLVPDSDFAERANDMIEQIDSRNRVNPRVVGAVLPLSGKLAKMGYKTLRGIQLGLGIYGPQPSNIRLAVIDSEGNPDLARKAVKRLVMEDNAVAIIGSLLSKTAVSVASRAQEFGVPNIALSQKAGITDLGPYVFRNALTSEMQVRQLVDIAMTKRKMTKFAILYPNDSYGVEFANLFWDEVLARGGKITAAQTYDPKETDFRIPIRRLVGTYYVDDRSSEYQTKLKAWKAKQKGASSGRDVPPEILPPVIDFDAIFIPDGPRAVGQIAPMLLYNDIEDVMLLGTNIWNSPTLVERAGKNVENSLFVDSYLADVTKIEDTAFGKAFQKVFEYKPDLFEVHGYDAAAVIRYLVERGVSTRTDMQNQLSQVQNFPGALGTITMSPRREVERPMLALTVKEGSIKPLPPEKGLQ
ncbi:MAG TPA: penicillin-binding protein activator [Bdellovibrionales bacterium]|nr:penicillin-binding protein activator [Bdellovibrionales bacterium]